MKSTIIAIIIGGSLVLSAIILSHGSDSSANSTNTAPIQNVTIVDGKQIVTVMAKGGYSPRLTKAKAGVPTTLRMQTNGTFDCTSALTIPEINYQKNLPPSGVTDIELPPQKAGTKLQGLCAMGMNNFEVAFE
jgi:plastocyanin domain-containing protein